MSYLSLLLYYLPQAPIPDSASASELDWRPVLRRHCDYMIVLAHF
jgi:hypothetical protein